MNHLRNFSIVQVADVTYLNWCHCHHPKICSPLGDPKTPRDFPPFCWGVQANDNSFWSPRFTTVTLNATAKLAANPPSPTAIATQRPICENQFDEFSPGETGTWQLHWLTNTGFRILLHKCQSTQPPPDTHSSNRKGGVPGVHQPYKSHHWNHLRTKAANEEMMCHFDKVLQVERIYIIIKQKSGPPFPTEKQSSKTTRKWHGNLMLRLRTTNWTWT